MKIPAPIDEKNVMSDWIQDVFDLSRAVESDNQMLGFVNGSPVYVYWHDNKLLWQTIGDFDTDYKSIISEIKQRLSEFEDPDSELYSETYTFKHSIVQMFYFKED